MLDVCVWKRVSGAQQQQQRRQQEQQERRWRWRWWWPREGKFSAVIFFFFGSFPPFFSFSLLGCFHVAAVDRRINVSLMKINHLWRGSVIVTMMMMSGKSVEWLQEELESGAGALLLLDCRPHELYESSHIESAINLAIPGLMLRRLKKGNLPIRSIIPNNEDKEKFVKRCKTDVVVLYDEATSERQESGLGSSVLGLLLQKLRDDGCKAFYLEGGFNKFQSEYPEHCETNLDCSCPSSSPPASVLGLGGLRISSDCSDGESDREPGSATESEGSPLPNNQPAFPVQILPYLYLGCAKDSTNLDVLSKYNIKYILNVTPNLPNMFEHEGDFKYKQIPISDHWSQNLSQFFPEAISFIGE